MKKSKSTVIIEKGKYLVDIEFSTHSLKNDKTSINHIFWRTFAFNFKNIANKTHKCCN